MGRYPPKRSDCPKCGGTSRVLEARFGVDMGRHFKRVQGIIGNRRRRECPECGHRWTTYELSDREVAILIGRAMEIRDQIMDVIEDFVVKVKAIDDDI